MTDVKRVAVRETVAIARDAAALVAPTAVQLRRPFAPGSPLRHVLLRRGR